MEEGREGRMREGGREGRTRDNEMGHVHVHVFIVDKRKVPLSIL